MQCVFDTQSSLWQHLDPHVKQPSPSVKINQPASSCTPLGGPGLKAQVHIEHEAIFTVPLEQLGFYKGPIIILNTLNFYKSFIDFIEHMVSGHFLRFEHKEMWKIADTPEEVLVHLSNNEVWNYDPRKIAKI